VSVRQASQRRLRDAFTARVSYTSQRWRMKRRHGAQMLGGRQAAPNVKCARSVEDPPDSARATLWQNL